MKFTIGLVCLIASSLAVEQKNDDKGKREAPVGYPSSGHSTHHVQIQPQGHGDSSAISIGAGYSVGGAKPSYSFGGLSASPQYQFAAEGLPSSGGHGQTIQLAPITLDPGQGGYLSSDLSQLMSQISQGLSTGAFSLQPQGGSYPAAGQEASYPQFAFTQGAPKHQQYSLAEPAQAIPSYAAGTKGLGDYSTGPVLFTPEPHSSQPSVSYGSPSSGHSFGAPSSGSHSFGAPSSGGHSFAAHSSGGHSFGAPSSGGHSFDAASLGALTLGGSEQSGHSFGGFSLGGAGNSAPSHGALSHGSSSGNSGHSYSAPSLASSGHSSHSGHSYGAPVKGYNGGYAVSSGSYVAPTKTSFKPSAYIGSSGDSSHGLSALSGSYSPSFSHAASSGHSSHGPSHSSGGHGASFGGSFAGFGSGSTKYLAPSYVPAKSEGFGSLETVASFASNGHFASPPGTTYGVPSASYAPSGNTHTASSSPQYYIASSKHGSPSSFGEGSSSFKAPSSSHSSLSSFPSFSSYSMTSHGSPSSRYAAPKDTQGAYSESNYNTIKYSTELKPRGH